MKELRFSLKTQTIPVFIEDQTGKTVSYTLREMTAADRDDYLDGLRQRIVNTPDGKQTIGNFKGMQADLLALCLKNPDGGDVTKEEIQAWPAPVVSDLFKAAQELNHLDQIAAPEKNG